MVETEASLNARLKIIKERIAAVAFKLTKHSIPIAEKRTLQKREHNLQLEQDALELKLDTLDMPGLEVAPTVIQPNIKQQPPLPPPPPIPEDLKIPEPPPLPPVLEMDPSLEQQLPQELEAKDWDVDFRNDLVRRTMDAYLGRVELAPTPKQKRCETWRNVPEAGPTPLTFPRWLCFLVTKNYNVEPRWFERNRRAAIQASEFYMDAVPTIEVSHSLICRTYRQPMKNPPIEDNYDYSVNDEDADPIESFFIEQANKLNKSDFVNNDWVMHGPGIRVFKPLVEDVATSLYGMIRRDEIKDLDKQSLSLVKSVSDTWARPVKEGGKAIQCVYSDVCRSETAAAAIEQAWIDLRRARDAVQLTTDATLNPNTFGVSSITAKERTKQFLQKYAIHRSLCARFWTLIRQHRWYPAWEVPVASHALAPLWVSKIQPKVGFNQQTQSPSEGFWRLYDALSTHKPLLPSLRPFPLPQPVYQIRSTTAL